MMSYIQHLTGYSFLEANWFYLLFLLPVLIWFLYRTNKGKSFGFKYTNTTGSQDQLFSLLVWSFSMFISIGKAVVFLLLIVSLTQPYKIEPDEPPLGKESFGIDLIFVLMFLCQCKRWIYNLIVLKVQKQ